ncbi:C6 zinc cluster transcription factor-like protein [Coniosporium apollinis]|uniref:C6 zinc cluster transcription factor-like protein n=1 Tax=Coniosporium apollinis TaxID=61459 RepID=A0ABQ9NLD7_9PEZI|nr:C6 zinc cluster transcription factor-like protein [Coniosporium apollinis]
MVLEVIYVVRHGYRSNWVVNPSTGTYTATVRSPTGIPSDPALASYGVQQAEQLAEKILSLDPPVDVVYSSPFYRCLQTLKPALERLEAECGKRLDVRVENGLGEFYGLARFDHPSPAPLKILHTHFSTLHPTYAPVIIPSTNGESIPNLHDRIAYALHRIISTLDADPSQPRALLICTHAASMIAIGRALTGRMPSDFSEEDFRCFTCALSKFRRRRRPDAEEAEEDVEAWDPGVPEKIPRVEWRGKGVKGGWECEVNGDCSFLSGGEERGWAFSGDEAFLRDPNAFNDAANMGGQVVAEGDGGMEAVDTNESSKGSRL